MADSEHAQKPLDDTVTDTPLTTYQKLALHFAVDDHSKVSKGSGSQTYAPWTVYVGRLNDVLGERWNFRIVREGFTPTECWVLGEITAEIDGITITRQQYGCEAITKGRLESPTSDLLKSAASDAIKKAASLLGVGLYLSDKEEREKVEAEMLELIKAQAQKIAAERKEKEREKNTPTPPQPLSKTEAAALMTGVPPVKTEARVKLEAAWQTGLTFAHSLGLNPKEDGILDLDDAGLEDVIGDLRTQCLPLMKKKPAPTGATTGQAEKGTS